MQNNTLITLLIGAVVGGLLTYLVVVNSTVPPPISTSQSSMTGHEEHRDSMSMQGMVEALKGKKGDEFDKTFIELMIEHHQGAIDMAKAAQSAGGHDELKRLAQDIISAQTVEINTMKEWYASWGYNK